MLTTILSCINVRVTGIPSSHLFVPPSIPQSVRSFTTFSGFCPFADKSLRRDSIKIGMLMYPDDFPSDDVDADGYLLSFHAFIHFSDHPWDWVWVLQTNHLEEKVYIWHADVPGWLFPIEHRYQWELLSFHAFIHPSNCPWAWVLVLRTNRLEEKSIFWHADVSRWLAFSLLMLIGIIAHLFICTAVWVRVWVGVGLAEVDGCCHHLGISVAITGSTF